MKMQDACCGSRLPSQGRCPGCDRPGREVERITLKALLRPEALSRLGPEDHSFCATRDCPVVYFQDASVYRREDVLVPVFQKEGEGARTICYCFEISEAQIQREIETSGVSASAHRIKALVRSGRCACALRNPQGSCCLGNVVALERAETETRDPLKLTTAVGELAPSAG